MSRATRLPWTLAVLDGDRSAPDPAATGLGRGDPRRGRALRSGGRPLPGQAAAARRLVARGRRGRQDRDHQPGDPGPAHRRRAGRRPDHIVKSLEYLRKFDPGQLDSVYSVALQTMVFAAARPKADIVRIQANVDWLEEAQLKPGDHALWPGSWSYKSSKDPARRQLELAIRPARPERRQRGRREGQ